jgi:hypothetical protein
MKHNAIDKTINAPQGFQSIAITNVIKMLPVETPTRPKATKTQKCDPSTRVNYGGMLAHT